MHFTLSDGMTLEPYLKVSGVHEFLTGDRITLDEVPFNPTFSGRWVDAGAGLVARLNRSVYLYGEYDYANSDKIRQPWAVNLGVRWEWGGRQKEAEIAEQPQQSTGKQAEAKMVQQPPVKTTEPWQNTVGGRGWLAGVTGNLGTHGVTSHVNIGFKPIFLKSNVVS